MVVWLRKTRVVIGCCTCFGDVVPTSLPDVLDNCLCSFQILNHIPATMKCIFLLSEL